MDELHDVEGVSFLSSVVLVETPGSDSVGATDSDEVFSALLISLSTSIEVGFKS